MSTPANEAALHEALKSVIDPNTGKDFVSTRALKNLRIEDGDVAFQVELGYPGKSQHANLRKALVAAARSVPGVKNVSVEITTKIVTHAVQRGVQLLPRVKNVIALAPVTDLSVDFLHDNSPRNNFLSEMIPDFLGSRDAQLQREASPLTYAGQPSDKRFYVSYANNDWLTTPEDQAHPFLDKMRAAGQDLTEREEPQGEHLGWVIPDHASYDPAANQRLAQWILAAS